jgi:hypothetical protein
MNIINEARTRKERGQGTQNSKGQIDVIRTTNIAKKLEDG